MRTKNWVVASLRLAILVVGAGLLLAQTILLPVLADLSAHDYPEFAWLQWPTLVLSIATLGAAEVALLGVWKLLTLVHGGTLFESPMADFWVRIEVVAVLLATGLVTSINALLSHAGANPPLGFVVLSGVALVGVGLFLLVVVLRHVLREASAEHRELLSVI